MEQKKGVKEVKQPRPKYEEVLARNPGLKAILDWSERMHDQLGGANR